MRRHYYCKTKTCELRQFMVGKPGFEKPQKCPGCHQPVVLQPNFTAFQKDVISNYPYLIALPFKRMLEEENQLKNLVFTFLNTLKYMALIVASEYYRSPFRDDSLNKTFKDGISKPLHATWNIYLTAAIRFLEENNHQFLIPELPLVYHSIETGEKHNKPKLYPIYKEVTNYFGEKVSERLDWKDVHGGKPTVIRALLFFRNKYDGHTAGAIADDAAEKVFDKMYELLTDLLTAMAFVKNYPLLKSDGNYYWSLMSYQVTKEGYLTETIKQEENIWLQNKLGNKLPMLPFFIQQSHFEVGLTQPAEIMMIEQYTGDRIIFHSPDGKNSDMRGDVLRQLELLLHTKEYEIPFNNQSFSKTRFERYVEKQNAAVELELKDEQKILEGIYQKRVETEIELRSWVGSIYGLFFLAAEAGSGKTNLLWEIKRQYEEDFTLTTIFIRANRMVHTCIEDELKRILNIEPACSLPTLDVLQHTQEKPLLVLIDGCNEHKNNLALLESGFQLLTQFTKGSLKIVLTWRANSKMEVPEIGNPQDSLLYPVTSSTSDNVFSSPQLLHWLHPFNKQELEGAWNNYTYDKGNKQFKPKFTLEALTLADRPLTDQLHNPLLLRLFLELFNGKTLQEKPVGFTNIWRLWWLHKVGTDATQVAFITRLALLMAENGSNHANINHLLADEILGPHIRSYEKSSPFNRLVAAGILTQYNVENISFTIEAVWHYTLSKHLAHHLSFTHNLAYYIAKGKAWEQAVMFYLWDAVQQKQTAPLIDAIKNNHIDAAIAAKPLAQALQILDVENVLAELLHNAGEKEWEILQKACYELSNAQKIVLLSTVANLTKNYVTFSMYSCVEFIIGNFNFFKVDYANEFISKFDSMIDDSIKNVNPNYSLNIKTLKLDVNFLLSSYLCSGLGRLCRNYYDDIEYQFQYKASEYVKKEIELNIKCGNEDGLDLALLFWDMADAYLREAYPGLLHIEELENKAKDFFIKGYNILIRFYDENNPIFCRYYTGLAELSDNEKEALDYLNKNLVIHTTYYGKDSVHIMDDYTQIANTSRKYGNYEQALAYYFKSLEIKLQFYGEMNLSTASTYSLIGYTYEWLGKIDKTIIFFQKAYRIEAAIKGTENEEVQDILRKIQDLTNRR